MKVFWFNLEAVKARLENAVQTMAEKHPEVEEVWLFGSVARGEAVPGSDADLLVVLEACDLPFSERSLAYQLEFCGVGVDIFAYTEDELLAMEAQGNPFLAEVNKDKICLFQRSKKEFPTSAKGP